MKQLREKQEARFAISIDLVKYHESPLDSINDRLISIGRNMYATIFSCYAPTMKSGADIKEHCYSESRNQFRSISIHDKLLVDFNTCALEWSGEIGKDVVGKINSNPHLLLNISIESIDTSLPSSSFKVLTPEQLAGDIPDTTTIDYVIVRSSSRNDIRMTRFLFIG